MEYETYIKQAVKKNQMNQDEILLSRDGENITVADFIEKTKQMKPWHRRLINDFTELQRSRSDIREYMRKYIIEKLNDGFEFKQQNG